MSLTALVSKEVHDLVREKRFGAWALVYALVWTVMSFVLVMGLRERVLRGGPPTENLRNMGEALYFVMVIALPILALFVATDGVARERESGMLPVVASSPVQRSHLLVAKLAAAGAAYVGAFIVTLAVTGLFTYAVGFAVIQLIATFFAIPFLALFIFFAGVGLLLGVVCRSSKVALGAAVGIYFPLFFLNPFMPLDELVESAFVKTIVPYTPFYAVQVTADSLLRGGYVHWGGLAATAAVGCLAAAAAFIIFSRQEGAL